MEEVDMGVADMETVAMVMAKVGVVGSLEGTTDMEADLAETETTTTTLEGAALSLTEAAVVAVEDSLTRTEAVFCLVAAVGATAASFQAGIQVGDSSTKGKAGSVGGFLHAAKCSFHSNNKQSPFLFVFLYAHLTLLL
jgi:hypothetical protein